MRTAALPSPSSHRLIALLGWAVSLAILLAFATLNGSRALESALWRDLASASASFASDPQRALDALSASGGSAWASLPGSSLSAGSAAPASALSLSASACADLPGDVRLCASRSLPWIRALDPSLPAALLISLPALALALASAARARRRSLSDRWLATRDPLTGLANRALLLDRLSLALERARRESSRLTVAFLDLDGFKALNDSLGHGAGDEALREAAARLTLALRSCDTIARYGGDEFALVLSPGISAELLQAKIDAAFAAPFLLERGRAFLGASCGCACFPEDGSSPEALLERADSDMYRRKRERKALASPASGGLSSPA